MKHKAYIKSPLIGISATLLSVESGSFLGCERSAVIQDYVQAVELAGGIPVILPIVKKRAAIQQQVEMIDGLLLSGGYDVCPLRYAEEPMPGLEAICPKRDAYELELIHSAQQLHKPILGICRGLQLLNVAWGGTLYQDIGLSYPNAIQHLSKVKPDEPTHTVTILPDTRLGRLMKVTHLLTNSFHHQAIKKLAPNLVVNAQTTDGIIEGIEGITDLFILGVQWHPELMVGKHPQMLNLFEAFVEAAQAGKER